MSLGQLEKRGGLAQGSGQRHDRAFACGRFEQGLDCFRDFVTRRLNPDSPFPAKQGHGARLVGKRRRVGLHRLAHDNEFFGISEPAQQLHRQGSRPGLVGTVEQVKADGRIGPLQRIRKAGLDGLHRPWARLRTNSASRDAI